MRTSPRKRKAIADPVGLASKPMLASSTSKRQKPAPKEETDESELDCPLCPGANQPPHLPGKGAAADRETWICCSRCRCWYHCICVRLENPHDYSKWYCQMCIDASQVNAAIAASTANRDDIPNRRVPRVLKNVERPPPRKSGRAKLEVDYAAIQEGKPADPIGRWIKLLDSAELLPDRFRRMKGEDWTLEWLMTDPRALSEPVLVPAPERKGAANGHRLATVQTASPDGHERSQRGAKLEEGSADSTTTAPPLASATAARTKTSTQPSPPPPPLSSTLPPTLQPASPVSPPSQTSTVAGAHDRFEPCTTSIPGMRVPPPDMTISDIATIIGPDTPVEVIDVASQSSSKAWTLSAWADYCMTPKEQRKKVLNVISLEVTGTPLERLVEAPQLVRDLDWVTRDWPLAKRGRDAREHSWPKVQRYVLMGVEGGYSDWHIDFAGSSVYYHVVYGQKTFLFAPPTPQNLVAYRTWCSSTRQDFDWLGDHVSHLTRVDIMPGETMLIPSGWLHSVYTPKNTLVVGGNFLTDWNVDTQWRLVDIEEQTKVPRKFRFPHLRKLTWYVAKGWHERLAFLQRRCSSAATGLPTDTTEEQEGEQETDEVGPLEMSTFLAQLPPRRVLDNIVRLSTTLLDDVDLILDPYEGDEKVAKARKTAKEAIPTETVGAVEEAAEMVQELRRRCEAGLEVVEEVERERRKGSCEPRSGIGKATEAVKEEAKRAVEVEAGGNPSEMG